RGVAKNTVAITLQLLAIPMAYVSVPVACVLLIIPPIIHFMPDRAAERVS
ncbi:MAG: hypothetical protein H7203_15695, partial [Rhizobacter sp.]|nr:hypothetical protein [Burkholderiales bacterium]